MLQKDNGFREAVLGVGEMLAPNTGGYFRVDFGTKYLPAQLAFGKVKLAGYFFKNPDGGIGVLGIAKDAYNFEWWETNFKPEELSWAGLKKLGKTELITAFNNMAYILQRAGRIKPFKYGVQINIVVYDS